MPRLPSANPSPAALRMRRSRAIQTVEQKNIMYEKAKRYSKNRRAELKQAGETITPYTSLKMREDEIENRDLAEFKSMFKNLTPESLNWSALIPRLQEYESDFNRLLPHQKLVFQKYWLPRFYNYVQTYVETERFYGDIKYIWNCYVWLRILLKLSRVKKRNDERDCLISTLPLSSNGRPQISKNSIGSYGAIFACVLKYGIPQIDQYSGGVFHASHLCHNKLCVSCEDLVFESCVANVRRCVNSCASFCQCEAAKCIWKRNGKYLPCRNTIGKFVCDCDLNCFAPLNLRQQDEMLDELNLEPENIGQEDVLNLGDFYDEAF